MAYTDLLTKPTIHLNGTSGEQLYKQNVEAAQGVVDAIEKLCAAAPNGRDYYPQGESAFNAARGEHEQRVRRLVEIRDELLAIAEHVQDQLNARSRR